MTFIIFGTAGAACGIKALVAFTRGHEAEGFAWFAALASCFVAWLVALWTVIA